MSVFWNERFFSTLSIVGFLCRITILGNDVERKIKLSCMSRLDLQIKLSCTLEIVSQNGDMAQKANNRQSTKKSFIPKDTHSVL